MKTDKLRRLCIERTRLAEQDIAEIIHQVSKIDKRQLYPDNDIFIDILDTHTNEAFVAYQRNPLVQKSAYSNDIVGEIAKRVNEPAVYRTLETSINSIDLLAETQEGQLVRQKVYPIRNEKRIIAVMILESKVNRNAIDREEENHRKHSYLLNPDDLLIDNLDTGILYFDNQGMLYKINQPGEAMYRRFGYRDNVLDLSYDNLSLDFSTFEQVMYQKSLANNTSVMEREIYFDQSYFNVKYVFFEQLLGFTMIIKDITDLKNKEEEVIHKSVAIQEIHHRVKNNLQSIIALLRIQTRRKEINADAQMILQETINRMLAIAQTHEILSKQVGDQVQLKGVLDLYIKNLKIGYDDNRIVLSQSIDEEIVLNSDDMVSLSLVVNELIQNSYKHAFTEIDGGTIMLSVKKCQRQIVVNITDTGCGYDTEDSSKRNFGLQIIKSYVTDKLHGDLSVCSSAKGTSTTIKFG